MILSESIFVSTTKRVASCLYYGRDVIAKSSDTRSRRLLERLTRQALIYMLLKNFIHDGDCSSRNFLKEIPSTSLVGPEKIFHFISRETTKVYYCCFDFQF